MGVYVNYRNILKRCKGGGRGGIAWVLTLVLDIARERNVSVLIFQFLYNKLFLKISLALSRSPVNTVSVTQIFSETYNIRL